MGRTLRMARESKRVSGDRIEVRASYAPVTEVGQATSRRRWGPTTEGGGQDFEESVRVALKVRAQKKRCFFNAREVILRLDDYADASYVEGFALLGIGMAIEHGWVVRDGVIIDPTLPGEVRVYYPGLEFKGRGGLREFLATPAGRKCKNSPFFFAFGLGGHESETFRRARQGSFDHMTSLGGPD